MTKIKICGITREAEADYLNELQIDYGGFVLYEKSKRNIAITEAMKIFDKLNQDIIKVAVTVSPDMELVRQIKAAGFDVIQIHGAISEEVKRNCELPMWRAVNLDENISQLLLEKSGAHQDSTGINRHRKNRDELNSKTMKESAILLDAKEYGSGKTFDWQALQENPEYQIFRKKLVEQKKQFVLAGGLTPENVAKGIKLFHPDIVDVSSGVESIIDGEHVGKDRQKIIEFVNEVRK